MTQEALVQRAMWSLLFTGLTVVGVCVYGYMHDHMFRGLVGWLGIYVPYMVIVVRYQDLFVYKDADGNLDGNTRWGWCIYIVSYLLSLGVGLYAGS